MERCIKEKYIVSSPEPVSLIGTEKILNQMNNCVCRIYNNSEGTGFFTKIPYNSKLLPVLITNNHVLDKNDISKNNIITIYLNNDKKEKILKIDDNRLKYTNTKLDITMIEIKENKDNLNNKYCELDNGIINYFKSNQKEDANYLNKIYSNKSIYCINYPEDKNVVVSYGRPPNLQNSEIYHKCSTKSGSSGSPLLLINNQKLIGVHHSYSKCGDYNKGTLLINAIIEFNKIKNQSFSENGEGKSLVNNNEIKNRINQKEDYECPRCKNIFPIYNKILHDIRCTEENPLPLSINRVKELIKNTNNQKEDYECPRCKNIFPIYNKILHDIRCTEENPIPLSINRVKELIKNTNNKNSKEIKSNNSLSYKCPNCHCVFLSKIRAFHELKCNSKFQLQKQNEKTNLNKNKESLIKNENKKQSKKCPICHCNIFDNMQHIHMTMNELKNLVSDVEIISIENQDK